MTGKGNLAKTGTNCQKGDSPPFQGSFHRKPGQKSFEDSLIDIHGFKMEGLV